MPSFSYEPVFQLGADDTEYRALGSDGVSQIDLGGRKFLKVEPRALAALARQAFIDMNFLFRPKHLKQLADELNDPQASDNDRFVIYTQLQNAVVSAAGELPSCQDTGTATVVGKKGQYVLTESDDAAAISEGIWQTYQEKNLRYSQIAPLEMFKEKNTGNNLPAQIDIAAETGDEYKFLFVAKGGGSANKMFLFQQTPAVLNENDLVKFLGEKLKDLGAAACPPYHVAIVVGGSSAEMAMKTLKLASAGYLDHLPMTGSPGGRAFRDTEMEQKILQAAYRCGVGAQFGGKFVAHDVRVIRMSRHAASCPIAIGVSCSADRNIKGKITKDGVFLEQLELHPEKYLPKEAPKLAPPVRIDLNIGMDKVRQILTKFPVKTRLELTGTLIVARDAAHARLKKLLDEGKPMPQYFKDHPIYYAGPAKTPAGMASGSIGGPAAILAQANIKKVELVDFEELGMEAIRKIEVVDFPAFIVVDDKGNDFFEQLEPGH